VTPLYQQKLALTSPTGGGRSVDIVRSQSKAMEFSFFFKYLCDKEFIFMEYQFITAEVRHDELNKILLLATTAWL
jgi:hypothetical protein